MGFELVEAVEQSIVDYLTANFDAKALEVSGRYSDGVELSDFFAIVRHEPFDGSAADFPLLFVIPEADTIETGAFGLRRGFEGLSRFVFGVVAHGENPDVARTRVKRYAVAVLECLAESYDADAGRPYEWGLGPAPIIDYQPTWFRAEVGYLAEAQIRISASHNEGAL